jgi:hypothetical protein
MYDHIAAAVLGAVAAVWLIAATIMHVLNDNRGSNQ